MNPIMEWQDIQYSLNGNCIVSVPDLTLHSGARLGIMGPNAAGKSTLLRILCLLERPHAGSFSYKGEEYALRNIPLELRRHFSMALQQPLLLDRSVIENISIGLKFRKMPRSVIKEKTEAWMYRFQISHLAHKNAKELSGGEAQRVNLARAMIVEPEVLFLDEPFAALDFPTKILLMEDLKTALKTSKTALVFVSHDLMEIQHLTNELMIIESGVPVQYGSTISVTQNPNERAAEFLKVWEGFGLNTTKGTSLSK